MITDQIISDVLRDNDWMASAHVPQEVSEWSDTDKISLGHSIFERLDKYIQEDYRLALTDDIKGRISYLDFYIDYEDDIIRFMEPQINLIWSARHDDDLADRTAIFGT